MSSPTLRSLTRVFAGEPRTQTVVWFCTACGKPEAVYDGPVADFDPATVVRDDWTFHCAACREGARNA